MKCYTNLLTTIIVASLVQSEGSGWRGIVPLRSTRAQVERQFGAFDEKCQCYKTENAFVRVNYATGPCTGDLPGWNVPRGTVLSLTVLPEKVAPFSEWEPDNEGFVKTTDHAFTTYYGNGERGIRYSISQSGFVTQISFVPSTKNNHRRCAGFPLTDGGVTAYRPYDEFQYESFEDITSRIGEFGIRLRKSPENKGYIIVYAAHNKKIAGVAEFAKTARNYLIKELEIDPKAIQALNGGYREKATVELFLIPTEWPAPVPNPTFGGLRR